MLAKIVETREGFATMTGEGTLASVFPVTVSGPGHRKGVYSPYMPRKMFAPGEHFVTFPIPSAPEHFAPADTDGNNGDSVGSVISARRTLVARGRR